MTTENKNWNNVENIIITSNLNDKYNSIGKLFEDIKGSTILENEIKINEIPELVLSGDDKDLGRQIVYYRQLKGYERKDLAKKLNIRTTTLAQYERGVNSITDVTVLNNMLDILDIREKIILPDYINFLMNEPSKVIEEYLSKKQISPYKFSSIMNVKYDTVLNWMNNKTKISRENYLKFKKLIA